MHSYHSTKAQPQSKASYRIFVAEVDVARQRFQHGGEGGGAHHAGVLTERVGDHNAAAQRVICFGSRPAAMAACSISNKILATFSAMLMAIPLFYKVM